MLKFLSCALKRFSLINGPAPPILRRGRIDFASFDVWIKYKARTLSAVVDSTFLQYTARAALFQTQNAIFSEIFLFFADFCVVDAKTAAFDAAKKGKSGEEAGKNRNGKVKRKSETEK